MKTVLDLFCCGGGFSKGFEQAGFKIVLGIDIDKNVKETFEVNHDGAEFLQADINELDPLAIEESYGSFDVIIGSPPCTDFSLMATFSRDVEKGLVLVRAFKKFIDQLKPTCWVMENVAVAQDPIKSVFPAARSKVLDAVDFGSPSIRKRVFVGNYPEPSPTHSQYGQQLTLDGRQLEHWETLSSVIDYSVNYGFISEKRDADLVYRKSRRKTMQGTEIGNVHYPDILDRPARTLVAQQSKGSREIHVIQVGNYRRFLTIPELSLANGFSKDFKWFGGDSNVISMIGNAVSPKIAYAIAMGIIEVIV